MTLTLNNAARLKQLDAFLNNSGVAAFDGGTAVLEVYSGAAPGAGNAATGTKLVSFTLPTDAFALAASNASVLNGVPLTATAVATGTAGYFRIRDAASTYIIEGTIGTDATIDNASIVSGQTVNLTSFSFGN